MKSIVVAMLILMISSEATASGEPLPSVSHYSFEIGFDLASQRLSSNVTMVVINSTTQSVTELPFLLYRLLKLERVTSSSGDSLPFTQSVLALPDEPQLQVNAILVQLEKPIRPGDSACIVMKYGGFIFGYPEVMAYVKDRISREYTLLRPDAYAYPLLAHPTFASGLAANDVPFSYEVKATVPEGYVAACGGALIARDLVDGMTQFTFRSKGSVTRFDLAVAKFLTAVDSVDQLSVYYLREDSSGARIVLHAAEQAIKYYSQEFGTPKGFGGYTIIEIPDGWGSQAGEFYFLQTAAAFQDTSRISEVYHEIAHTWNVEASSQTQRCRYFDEAFASYFESLAIRTFRGRKAFESDMESSRRLFVQWGEHDPKVLSTPIAQYGQAGMGRHSYTKGAWSLYVLHHLLGDDAFRRLITTMLLQFHGKTIDFRQFQRLGETIAQRSLSSFFEEWVFGNKSSDLLVQRITVNDIVLRYRER